MPFDPVLGDIEILPTRYKLEFKHVFHILPGLLKLQTSTPLGCQSTHPSDRRDSRAVVWFRPEQQEQRNH